MATLPSIFGPRDHGNDLDYRFDFSDSATTEVGTPSVGGALQDVGWEGSMPNVRSDFDVSPNSAAENLGHRVVACYNLPHTPQVIPKASSSAAIDEIPSTDWMSGDLSGMDIENDIGDCDWEALDSDEVQIQPGNGKAWIHESEVDLRPEAAVNIQSRPLTHNCQETSGQREGNPALEALLNPEAQELNVEPAVDTQHEGNSGSHALFHSDVREVGLKPPMVAQHGSDLDSTGIIFQVPRSLGVERPERSNGDADGFYEAENRDSRPCSLLDFEAELTAEVRGDEDVPDATNPDHRSEIYGDNEHNSEAASEDEHSPHHSPKLRLSEKDFCRRELRLQTKKAGYGHLVDQDQSGDYNPTEEERAIRAAQRRSRARAQNNRARRQAKKPDSTCEDASTNHSALAQDITEESHALSTGQHSCIPSTEDNLEPSQDINHKAPRLSFSQMANMGQCRVIETLFFHPVVFNCDAKYEVECNFCSEPVAQMVGYGERQVRVFDYHDCRPLLATGPVDGEYRTTNVCYNCTWKRVKIAKCPKHELEPIKAVEPKEDDHLRAFNACVEGRLKHMEIFCTLCFRIASWQCTQHLLPAGGGQDVCDDFMRCGLRLCASCDAKLKTAHGGNFRAMLGSLGDCKPSGMVEMWRADAEFYRAGTIDRHLEWVRRGGLDE